MDIGKRKNFVKNDVNQEDRISLIRKKKMSFIF